MGCSYIYQCEKCGESRTIYGNGEPDCGFISEVTQKRCANCSEIVAFWRKKFFDSTESAERTIDYQPKGKDDDQEIKTKTEFCPRCGGKIFTELGEIERELSGLPPRERRSTNDKNFEEDDDEKEEKEGKNINNDDELLFLLCPECGGKMKIDPNSFTLWD